jgi:predicted dehydrogenase
VDKIKIGVVGVGWVAQVVHLPILIRSDEAQVVAICDRDKSRARLVAEKFGIKSIYSDVKHMLESEALDAVLVATSTDSHKDVVIEVLKHGKDVLVEKPIARKYEEAVAIADAAREHKAKVMVGMNHRFRPDTMLLKSFLEGKELGKVFYTKASWLRKKSTDRAWLTKKEKSGGGVFIDLGIVMLDMAFWMMGYPDVKRVSATNFHHTTKEVEDTSCVTIAMKNGTLVTVEVSWAIHVEDDAYSCQVFGTDGTASLNPLRINKELHGNMVNLAPTKLDPPQHLFKRSYENELKHFIGAVKGMHPVISTADEAVQRMRIVDAVYKSARTGRDVQIG